MSQDEDDNVEQPREGPKRGRTGEFEPCIVFVGNLDYGTTWQRLKDLFRKAGAVRFADLIAASDGRPKGSAIVTFEDPVGADNAVKMFHDSEFDGRRILVRRYEAGRRPVLVDTKRQQRRGGGRQQQQADQGGSRRRNRRNRNRGDAHGGGQKDQSSSDSEEEEEEGRVSGAAVSREMPRPRSVQNRQDGKLFVSNLPFQCTSQGLRDTFAQVGRVIHAEIITSSSGRSRGMGLVEFATNREAKLAIEEFDGIAMAGRAMSVRFERP